MGVAGPVGSVRLPLADPGLQRFVKAYTLRSHKGPEGADPTPHPLTYSRV